MTSADVNPQLKIRGIIQRELFPSERIVSLTNVSKAKEAKKKKLPAFFCITVTSSAPIQVRLHTVKKAEKGDGFKKKVTWELNEIKFVDAKQEEAADTGSFDIQLEKTLYKWTTDSVSERNDVVRVLWKLTRRYLKEQPKFQNVGNIVLSSEASGDAGPSDLIVEADFELDPLNDLAYQVISPKEEDDITKLMQDCEIAIYDANKFTEKLQADLQTTEAANMHSIVGSEKHVEQLMQLIDEAIEDANRIELKLTSYDEAILVVKEEMERMKVKDDMIKIQENNYESLIGTLNTVVDDMEFTRADAEVMTGPDLATPQGIARATLVARKLQSCMDVKISPAMLTMRAVREQKSFLVHCTSAFSKKLAHHVNNLVIHKDDGTMKLNTLSHIKVGDIKIRGHTERYKVLSGYTELMLWLKKADNGAFLKLQSDYQSALSATFEREINWYLEGIKHILSQATLKHGTHGSATLGSSESLDLKNTSANKKSRLQFNQLCEKVLNELLPVCQQEQSFCVQFFHFVQPEVPQDQTDNRAPLMPDGVFALLAGIFRFLDKSLIGFITHCIKQDTFYSLSLLVHLSHYTNLATERGVFATKILGAALVTSKRSFDKYITCLCQTIEEAKPNKKSRCGIITFVHLFEEFAEQSEHIFHGSARRSDLDRAYKQLASTLFNEVARIASEHGKTPRHVVMMENFHRINDLFLRLKITCLDAERKEAKQRYQEHHSAYVQEQLGRPMEKLTLFFEGVDEKLKTGVKAEEVGYLLAFNKQELRKVIKEYPAKEVRKGLEQLYRKVDKHLSDEENLLEVVWNSMQREFLNQYKLFEDMLKTCYKNSNLELEFTIDDMLKMFSEIAQLH